MTPQSAEPNFEPPPPSGHGRRRVRDFFYKLLLIVYLIGLAWIFFAWYVKNYRPPPDNASRLGVERPAK